MLGGKRKLGACLEGLAGISLGADNSSKMNDQDATNLNCLSAATSLRQRA